MNFSSFQRFHLLTDLIAQIQILTGNRIGIINIFDVRSNESKATTKMLISTEDDKRSNCVTCIAYHPNQKHVVSEQFVYARYLKAQIDCYSCVFLCSRFCVAVKKVH